MRILQVVQGFPPEFTAGTELYCQALTRALRQRGHRCFVLAGANQLNKEPALVTTEEEEGICVTRYMSPLSPLWREQQIDPYNPEAELLVRQHLRTVHPDVIHVQHWLRLTTNMVSVAADLGIPAIVTLHDLWTSCARIHRQHRLGHFCQEIASPSLCSTCVERFPRQSDEEVRRAIAFRQEQIAEELRLASCLLAPSEPHAQFLSTLLSLPPDRFRIVPHGAIVRLTPRSDTRRSGFPHRPLRLAYWGYLVHHKGVHLLLEAVRRLHDPSTVEVYLTGLAPEAPYLAHLQDLAKGLGVTIAGEYRPADLALLDIDIAVFPSLAYESYSFVLDEALQLGLPVIVSDRGALAARAGEAGLVFSAGDAEALARKIQAIVDTPSLLEQLRRKIPSAPSPPMEEHVQAMEAIYQEAQQTYSRQPAAVAPSPSRRLVFFHARLAVCDQEIVDLGRELRQRSAILEDREAALARQERELRQKEEEIAHLSEEVQGKAEELTRLHGAMREKEEELHHRVEEVALLDRRLHEETVKAQALATWLHKIDRSVGWRLLNSFYRVRERLVAPPGTRRGKYYDLLKRLGVAFAEGGPVAVFKQSRERLNASATTTDIPATTTDPYQLWLARHVLTTERIRSLQEETQALPYQPTVSIVTPVYNTEETWLRKAIESVRSQIYPHWELCICDDGSTAGHVSRVLAEYAQQDERIRVVTTPQNRGISGASNHALSLATGEFVGFLDHDDELTPDALCEVVKLLNEKPELDFIYTDEDKLTVDGRREEPFFKPDWSPDLLLSMNYIAHFAVVRATVLQAIGGFTEGMEGSQDYDLFLRISEQTQAIGHIAKPLYGWRKIANSTASAIEAKPYAHEAGRRALQEHLQRQQIAGDVVDGLVPPFRYRVRYQIIGQPLVSIIIPIKDKVELLDRCLKSIEEKTTYRRFEIIIVDNQSEEPETLEYLSRLSHTVVSLPGPFNYSHINNVGVTHARGEFLVFLNNDTEVITGEWLTAMLEHAQRPQVGAVGAKLLYPNDTIQHAGVVLGHGGVAGHAFWYLPEAHVGYFNFAQIIRNCSAVTAACLMMRKSVFSEIGGFDEKIRVAFNDVDLCLRIREKGYLIVYTPYALLYHLESASRKKLHPMSDEAHVRTRWGSVVQAGDPYYNPHLSLERFDFSLRIIDQGAARE